MEGLGHADSGLNRKRFGVSFPFIFFCGAALLLEFLPLCLRAAVLVLVALLFFHFPVHPVH